jgi:transporter family-2 protein
VAGQLAGALLLDAVVPGGPGVSLPLALGAVLTVVAFGVAGIGPRAR